MIRHLLLPSIEANAQFQNPEATENLDSPTPLMLKGAKALSGGIENSNRYDSLFADSMDAFESNPELDWDLREAVDPLFESNTLSVF